MKKTTIVKREERACSRVNARGYAKHLEVSQQEKLLTSVCAKKGSKCDPRVDTVFVY